MADAQKTPNGSSAHAEVSGCKAWLYVERPAPGREKVAIVEDILANLRSGVTLGLVNLPLSVSLAIAYGGTPEMGALSAFWGSLIGGLANGSQFSLHAPTGGLSGVLGGYSANMGYQCLPILALLTSFICMLCWKFNLHRFLTIFPACGMMGFKLGIGVIIALNQLNFALGLDPSKIQGWESHDHWWQRIFESFKNIEHTKPWNPVLFLCAALPLYCLTTLMPVKQIRILPWHMIFVCIGIIIGYILNEVENDFDILLLKDRFTLDPYIVGITKKTAFWAGFDGADWGGLIGASIPVAVIAILETQIAAKLSDVATGTVFDSKREVLGTALSNLVCGITGGAPVCGAMARMTLNINTGAKSRTSLVINSFVVLILTFLLFPFFKFLPQPVIGAVLVPVAVSMIKRKVYIHYWKMDKPAFIQCMTVFLVCVFVDPTYAIIVAIILGCLREAGNMRMIAPADCALVNAATGELIRSASVDQALSTASSAQQGYLQLVGEDFMNGLCSTNECSSVVAVYRPSASWTFTNKTQHADRLGFLREKGWSVIISLVHLHYIDLDGLDCLRDTYAAFKKAGVSLVVCDYNETASARLGAYEWYQEAVEKGTAQLEFATALKTLQLTAPKESGQEDHPNQEETIVESV